MSITRHSGDKKKKPAQTVEASVFPSLSRNHTASGDYIVIIIMTDAPAKEKEQRRREKAMVDRLHKRARFFMTEVNTMP